MKGSRWKDRGGEYGSPSPCLNVFKTKGEGNGYLFLLLGYLKV